MTSHLFSPLRIGTTTARNRIVIAPMCQYTAKEGVAQPWHFMHYGTFAASGAGVLVLEATAVTPEGRISPNCLVLQTDEQEKTLAKLVQEIQAVGPVLPVIQLAHAGRKASSCLPWQEGTCLPITAGGWQTVAPSALPMYPTDTVPHALTHAEIQEVKEQFVQAAVRAKRAGFAGIELHAAHGYLLHQFLSPSSNTRTDEYGGSAANRMRLVLETFQAMQRAVGKDYPVGIRLSATDWTEDGWTSDETVLLCQQLEALGCAFFDISSGGLSAQQAILPAPGYQVPFAEAVKQAVSAPVFAVGLITDPHHAESIIASGKADAVALGRGMLWNPRWPWHAAATLGAKTPMPPQYWRSLPHGVAKLYE